MSDPIIIDTSAFISLGTITDSNYKRSQTIGSRIQKENRSVIVPGDIFTEVINVIGKKVSHKAAAIQANEILSSKTLIIVETTPKIRNLAFEKFKKQPASVSFTDCFVMAFADEFETKEIFGFDEAFRKNGYVRFGIDRE
ncbi:MAG: PIN domain-containing protein [Candidatus Levybacteria bacterium]|nr:PIN domain-containing protein [Candidatus Levybacteria bacterium]MBI2189942.1 PIN domain-containing protein [Candidatus Levybacteria bacterium]MBI3092730.1 PIN domain-containing protein [Candidatus Levybacteria bacterium]